MSLFINETGTPAAPTIIFLHGIGGAGWMETTKKSGVAVLFFILVASHTSGVPSSYAGCVATIVAAAARVADAPGAIITATRIGTAVPMTENPDFLVLSM